jgi:hypothetical protein
MHGTLRNRIDRAVRLTIDYLVGAGLRAVPAITAACRQLQPLHRKPAKKNRPEMGR